MIRMLASILPGVIVGLGVIAYLERDHLREEWSSVFGSHEEEIHQLEAEEEQADLTTAAVIEEKPEPVPISSNMTELSATIFETEKVETEKIETEKIEVEQSDLTLVELEQTKRTELVDLQESIIEVDESTPSERPVLGDVLGLGKKEQQLMDYEMTDDLQILPPEQIASISKPIQGLAEQFNPLQSSSQAPYGVIEEKRAADIWHVDSLESESQLQWLWNRGRQAFWEGDYELAVESYRSLLQEEPMNPDGWGELGNIYYAKRDWIRAVRAFGRAAAALIELDRADEAGKIVTVIRGIDPMLADKLSADLSYRAPKDQ